MRLADQLRPLFPARARSRAGQDGEISFVVIEDAAPDGVRATVHGRESHEVLLRLDPPAAWSASCTCPLFRRTGACRHVWSVVLEADERRLSIRDAAGEGEPSYTALDPRREVWRARLGAVHEELAKEAPDPWEGFAPRDVAPGVEVQYIVDIDDTKSGRGLVLRPFWRERHGNRRWSRRRPYDPEDEDAPPLDDAVDGKIFRGLRAARRSAWTAASHLSRFGGSGAYWLDDAECDLLLPLLCESGRAFLHHHGTDEVEPLAWDQGEPWAFGAALEREESTRRARIVGFLQRPGERVELIQPHLVIRAGFVFFDHTVARLDARGAWVLLDSLRKDGPVEGPLDDAEELAQRLVDLPGHPLLEGEGLHLAESVRPRPHLEILGSPEDELVNELPCRIQFRYGKLSIGSSDPRGALREPATGFVVRRAWRAEREALRTFLSAGGLHGKGGDGDGRVLSANADELILRLAEAGWSAEVGGRACRPAGQTFLRVRTGIDWFDLDGEVRFGSESAPVSELLAALDEGRKTVKLADGSVGLLPESVRREWALFTGMGERAGAGLRFKTSQGWLLDRLLAQREGVDLDERFAALRRELGSIEGIAPVDEPDGFQGTLRPYQRMGLGWMHFLTRVGFGGCLADDMGLGKTVQVLALLEERRRAGDEPRPALVVVPKSLLFNWRSEARRFAPDLQVIEYTGPERSELLVEIPEHDVVLTTYGTLRRDILTLRDVPFGYVILDEAQAIKNPSSHSAKAARLLDTRNRLALSGTPIENHLGELWSLFEFLNPGMLGRAPAFKRLVAARGERMLDEGGRTLLAAALRPFFLRRTKAQVLPDLPPKVEQILWCELGKEQRAQYDGLLAHFREKLSGSLHSRRFEVLSALLRLRQSACHPALMEEGREEEQSAKLEVLLPHLEELVDSGHKALVFSQFTTHLGVVRKHLDGLGLPYAYLDGKTRDRESVVKRFREDPDCPLFLMSLKAGGLGLNLVEADYVFLLDPWWNPAAETQAIDRAHRIGRTSRVVAYRLIARDTVEEKILALQDQKRALADAVLATDEGWMRSMSVEDLTKLFV